MTKSLGTLIVVIICILLFTVAIGLIGGLFGIIIGIFGAVFGAIFGIIGGIFGAVFGFIGWIFDFIFGFGHHWDGPFNFHDCNIFSWAIVFLIVALIVRTRK